MGYSIIKYNDYRDFVAVIGEKDYVKEYLSEIKKELDSMKGSVYTSSSLVYDKVIKSNENGTTSVYGEVYIELDSRFNRFGVYTESQNMLMPRGNGYFLRVFQVGVAFREVFIDITDEMLEFIDTYETGFESY